MHTEAHLFSVPNDCLWYDKLWGPSQRVVTLLTFIIDRESDGIVVSYVMGILEELADEVIEISSKTNSYDGG